MAGNLFWKESSTITVSTNGSSFANGTLINAGTLDNSSTGVQAQYLVARASLNAQWNATSGIVAGTDIVDLYMIPQIDRSTTPAFSSSFAPPGAYVGSFICATNTVASSTFVLFDSGDFELRPWIYTVAMINQSGQTIASSWTLKIIQAEGQYT